MAVQTTKYKRYIPYEDGESTRFVTYSVIKKEHTQVIDWVFRLQGSGVPGRIDCQNLGQLLHEVKRSMNVKDKSLDRPECRGNTCISKAHHSKVLDKIQKEVDDHGESMGALKYIEQHS